MIPATATRTRLALAALALGTLAALGACVGSDDPLLPEGLTPLGGAIFSRYVSLGGSIAAGIQSGGINGTTQRQAYPALLAARMGTSFGIPLLADPGCPALFTAPLVQPTGTPPCALRVESDVPRIITNLAVPQTTVAQTVAFPTGSLATIQTFLIGPRTQLEALAATRPTFVSVHVGDQDVLTAALAGVLGPAAAGGDSLLTPIASFQASYDKVVAALKAVPTLKGAVLVGVFDPVGFAPLYQPGAYFYLSRDASGNFQGKPVNTNCSPVTNLGTPNPLAANMLSFQAIADATIPELNCDPASPSMNGRFQLTTAEQQALSARVAAINTYIASAATANGWAFVDPNVTLTTYRAEVATNGRFDRLRKCQLLPTATTAAQFQTAVLNSCPVTGPTAAPNFFGNLISFDGVHPSATGQIVYANAVAAAINAKYGTTLPIVTVP